MKFDYELVNEYIQKLEKALKTIQDKYKECENQIHLIKSSDSWVGPASNNYITKATKAIDMCKRNERALNNIINYIKKWYENYDELETEIKEAISTNLE